MADVNPPVVGNASAFERSAKAILARAEAALKASVSTLAEVKGLAGQIEASAAASQGEEQAAAAINRKANAAERAAAAVALQNQHMRAAAGAAQGETAAAVALERKAAAAERAAAALAEANAAGVRPAQARINAEQRLLELQARNAEIERSAAARQNITTGGQAERSSRKLDYQEQVPLRRQQGAEQARQAAEQSRIERDALRNSQIASRGYSTLGAGVSESTAAINASSLAMVTNAARTESLGAKLAHTAGEYARFTVATGGLFAVFGVFHQVYEGAKESQQGVQALHRVLAEFNEGEATAGFARLSREVNVPIRDAAEATQLMARQFQNLPEALAAARVALGFTKLDAISTADSVRFLGAAAQAFHLSGTDLERRVADPIENVARRGGEPPGQILRAFAASAQIANAGGSPEMFAGLVGAAIRASAQTGNVVATAFQRSIANAIPRAKAQDTIRAFGLDPEEATTNYTRFIERAIRRSRDLTNNQRRELALAIGGQFFGSRVFQPLLQRPEQSLDRLRLATTAADRPGAFQNELDAQLKRIDERIHRVGNAFQRLGEQLASAHILDPFIRLLGLFGDLTNAAGSFVGTFNKIVPDSLHGMTAGILEVLAAVALFRRFNVGERLANRTSESGLIGRFIPESTRNRVVQQQARAYQEEQLARESAEARMTRDRAARRYGDAASAAAGHARVGGFASEAEQRAYDADQARLVTTRDKARGALLAADARVSRLEQERLGLAQREVVTLNAVARARAEANAAQGIVNAETAAGVGMGGTKGIIAGGALGAMFGNIGAALAPLAKLGGMILAFEAIAKILEGFEGTHGNLDERIAGAMRSVSGQSAEEFPITGSEQQRAGRRQAIGFIRDLPYANRLANPNVARERISALAQRRATLQRDLDNEYYARGEPAQLKAERDALDREIRREAATAVQQQAAARIKRTRGRQPLDQYLALNSEQLGNLVTGGVNAMTRTGDDSGFDEALHSIGALSVLGHRKDRPDLLDKADQAIRQVVGAVGQELQDNLALADSQRERDDAYRDALSKAEALQQSSSPEARRQGRVLERQTRIAQLGDYTAGQDAQLEFARSVSRDPQAGARMGVTTALRQYEHTLKAYNYDRTATPVRQARTKLEQARNASDDADLQAIELDTATRQANATTARGKADALVTGLEHELERARSARHPDTQKITQLENQLADARMAQTQQIVQDANAATDAYYAYLEAVTDDPLQQALLEQQRVAAQRLDPTDPNAAAKQKAANAQQAQRTRQALHQDAQDRINARFDRLDALADPGDTVAAAERAERRARTLRRNAPGLNANERERQANDVRRTHAETVRARQQAAYDDIQHNAAVGKLTTDMEVAALRRMLSTVHHNKALRRQIEEQIYSLTHQDQGGGLELQLGNIRLPTPYEVNRAIREAGGGRRGAARGMNVHNSVQVNVTGDTDLGKMANAIDSVVGTSTRSALRAAGVL